MQPIDIVRAAKKERVVVVAERSKAREWTEG
jgi:hypothetical protein